MYYPFQTVIVKVGFWKNSIGHLGLVPKVFCHIDSEKTIFKKKNVLWEGVL